jgi:hypothetical protein
MIMGAVGIAVLLPGVVVFASSRRELKKIYRGELEKQRRHESGFRLSGLDAAALPDKRGIGIGATFSF